MDGLIIRVEREDRREEVKSRTRPKKNLEGLIRLWYTKVKINCDVLNIVQFIIQGFMQNTKFHMNAKCQTG